jgi:crotonobetainyl-CoA:carnitine CoA-transferase CaiB-like acyl-CoA transferase
VSGGRAGTGPLAGITVVEVADIITGPLCGVLLAEMGAEVIKVETYGSSMYRRHAIYRDGIPPLFYNTNRGKKSVCIDAKTPEGRAVLGDLVAGADVLLTNLRPGKPDGIGLSYESVRARNPRVVYTHITGFGDDGPYASLPTWDFVIQGVLGMVDYQTDPVAGTMDVNRQVIVDKSTAYTACQAVLGALFARERTGEGQFVQVTMAEAGLAFFWCDALSAKHTLPERTLPFDVKDAYRVYATADGHVVTMPTVTPFERVALALDRPEWLVDERFTDPATFLEHMTEALALYATAFASFTTDEVMARFAEHDVPLGRVNTRDEMLRDPQIVHMGAVIERDHVAPVGPARQPVPPWRFAATPAEPTDRIALLGQDTRSVLAERLGLDDAELDRLHALGALDWPV